MITEEGPAAGKQKIIARRHDSEHAISLNSSSLIKRKGWNGFKMKDEKNGNGNTNGVKTNGNGNGVKTNGNRINSFHQVLDSLMEGAQGVLTSKTVVGEPITVGDTIIIPLSDVSIGVGAGSNGAERKDGGMGGFSAKMVPSAVLVIKNNITKVVNVRDQTSLTHIMDMIPEVIDKIRSRNTEMISDEDAVNTAFPDKNK